MILYHIRYIHTCVCIYIYICFGGRTADQMLRRSSFRTRSQADPRMERWTKCLRGTKGVPRKGVWASVNMRVRTCKELSGKHDQTSCYLWPPFLGTPLVPSRNTKADQRADRGTGARVSFSALRAIGMKRPLRRIEVECLGGAQIAYAICLHLLRLLTTAPQRNAIQNSYSYSYTHSPSY